MEDMYSKPNISQFMYNFADKNRIKFNQHWFERNDDDLIKGMEQVILSCERNKYFILKVLNFEVVKNYEEIQRILKEYYDKKTKNGKRIDNDYDNINLKDSDIMLLLVTYYIKLNLPEDKIPINKKTGLKERSEGTVQSIIALPIYVNKYYYRLYGNYYSPMFQIVDGSTYNNSTSNAKTQSITLKTQFMPIKVYKEYQVLKDLTIGNVQAVLYTSYVFTKKTDTMKFILGRYGIYGAAELLEIGEIYITKDTNFHKLEKNKHHIDPPMDPTNYYNFVSDDYKIVVSVPRMLFDSDRVTQSFVYTLIKNVKKYENFEDIFDVRYWNRSLGADFLSATLDKGIPVLDSFESIYDLKTKDTIRLPIEDKIDSYTIIRWIMREFSYLRKKDNLDISTKRPRITDEYLPSIYAMKLSKGIYRISDKGKNITFKDVMRVVDTDPEYIMKNINAANLVSYVDLVNDNDAELALAYTYKGISGLGEQSSGTAVPIIYRSVHPSHLGRVDPDASSSSDPGLSGIITPTAKTYDGAFSDFEEPNGWKDWYTGNLKKNNEELGLTECLSFSKKQPLEYDYVKEEMVRETIESFELLRPALLDNERSKDYTIGAIIGKDKESENDDEDSDGCDDESDT